LSIRGAGDEQRLPILAAAATGILVGAAMVATRSVAGEIGPASLAFLRYLIGFCCIAPPALLSPRIRFETRDLLPIGLLGVVQFGILIALLNYALQFIPSARAALIFATMPLLTMVLATMSGREPFSLGTAFGVMLTVLGVGLALGERSIATEGPAPGSIGDLAAFASALCGAACSILYRPYLRKYPTLPVSAVAMLASVVFLAVVAAAEGFFTAPPELAPGGWLAVIFIGLSSGLGYVLWLWALNHAAPTRVTIFLALSPVTAALLGAILLGEAISLRLLAGLGCVVLGLRLAGTSRSGARETMSR
jgi:drug/metabolite transporter (DMT)-like permease